MTQPTIEEMTTDQFLMHMQSLYDAEEEAHAAMLRHKERKRAAIYRDKFKSIRAALAGDLSGW